MIQIKVFGTTPPCASCKRAEREAKKAAAQFPGQVDVVKLDVMSDDAQQYGLVMTPLVVVDDEVVGSGRVVPAAQLVPVLETHLKA
jgi:disulfide oxidoreductase YuzD